MFDLKRFIIGIGIDQGIANCGFSAIRLNLDDHTLDLLEKGSIVTSSKKSLPERIFLLHDRLYKIIHKYEPSIIGCEKLFFNSKIKEGNRFRNKSASIVYTNMATGILYLIAGQKKVPLHEFAPTTIKKYVTGNGKAEKDQVKKTILNMFKEPLTIKNSHESDAIAIGITAVKFYKEQMVNTKGVDISWSIRNPS